MATTLADAVKNGCIFDISKHNPLLSEIITCQREAEAAHMAGDEKAVRFWGRQLKAAARKQYTFK